MEGTDIKIKGNGRGKPRNNPQNPGGMPDTWLKFADNYIRTRNGAESAKLAGYLPKYARQTANRLLGKDVIQKYIAGVSQEAGEKAGITEEFVLRELKDLYNTAKVAGDGATAHNCLKSLGNHLGMFKDRESSGPPVNILIPPAVTVDEFMRAVEAAKARGQIGRGSGPDVEGETDTGE